MFVPFNTLPPHSRLWIYQAGRSLDEQEEMLCATLLKKFTESWAAHGVPLMSSFQILDARFIVLGVDQAHHEPSGCSIDTSVSVIRELEKALETTLLDRSFVPFRHEKEVVAYPLKDLKELASTGQLTPETLTFNILAATKAELETWEIPAGKSWVGRYFKKATSL